MCDRPLPGCSSRARSHGPEEVRQRQSMLQLKSFEDIGGFDAGWLKAKHHFAIGPYGNPAHKAVGNLIVLNDDEIAPRTGFGLHHHENVEIVSYLREGTVTHRDDRGNLGKTRAGDVQVMSAGTGIRHSEQNEEDVPIRLFQIWLKPSAAGGIPRWGNKPFPKVTALASSCLLPAAATPKVRCRFALTPKCTGPCFGLALRQAIPSAKETRAI